MSALLLWLISRRTHQFELYSWFWVTGFHSSSRNQVKKNIYLSKSIHHSSQLFCASSNFCLRSIEFNWIIGTPSSLYLSEHVFCLPRFPTLSPLKTLPTRPLLRDSRDLPRLIRWDDYEELPLQENVAPSKSAGLVKNKYAPLVPLWSRSADSCGQMLFVWFSSWDWTKLKAFLIFISAAHICIKLLQLF